MTKKILVTGSEGYIGTVLTDKLLKKGYAVTGLDTNFFKNTRFPSTDKRYTLIQEDIRRAHRLDFSGYEAIIHLAALSNDITGDIRPAITRDINHLASVHLAQKAKREGVKRFLFSSSCSIYGIAKHGIVDETSPIHPATPYAQAKVAAERELQQIADGNFCVGILRNSTVYGYSANFRNDLVVNNLVTCALSTGTIPIKSDGTPWRPLIDVRDVSDVFIEFLEAESAVINGTVFNVGFNENNVQVRDIAYLIQKQLPDCSVVFTGEHGADVRTYRVNFDAFHRAFPNIKQKWPLPASIRHLIGELSNHTPAGTDFYSGTYTRLDVLNRLRSDNRIDADFYWTAHV